MKIRKTLAYMFICGIAMIASFGAHATTSVAVQPTEFDSILSYAFESGVPSDVLELSNTEMEETLGDAVPVVYVLVAGARIVYVGITRNATRRLAEHGRGRLAGQFDQLRVVARPSTPMEARIIEQALINKIGLGNLLNRINSISPLRANLGRSVDAVRTGRMIGPMRGGIGFSVKIGGRGG
ncbi:MAG: GIY-YIG nuclease family protein [Pseudomonadota bacterium]